jgi:acetolactate synthase small subunit
LLKLTLVGSPGGLTNVVQVFSTLDISVERLEYNQKEGADGLATLVAWFAAEDRNADLLVRKLTRLIEVLSVEVIVPTEVCALPK